MRRYLSATLLIACITAAVFGSVTAGAVGPVSVTYEGAFGSLGLGEGQFTYPTDVATDKWGNVYVAGGTNGDHRVQMFDADGEFIKSVGTTVTDSTELSDPRSLATDRWGNIYVVEMGNGGRVHPYGPELWSSYTPWDDDSVTSSERITSPTGIGVAPDGTVYTVSDSSWVQRWDSYGTFLNAWTTGVGGAAATGVAPSSDGEVYVANDLNATSPHTVQVFKPWGSFVREWGGLGADPGDLNRPYDVGIDGGDAVFVMDTGNQRAQVLTPEGTPLAMFGGTGTLVQGRMSHPYGLGVGGDRTVYVADTFNHRISKWGVTHPARTVEVAGGNRYATAVAASQKAFPSPAQSEYAVIATGRNWPDALGGAALAGVLKAPLLLTARDSLSPEVTAELERLDVQEILVLGGSSAVSDAVYDELATKAPGGIRRVAGANRYETANEIATEVAWAKGPRYDGTAFVVTGQSFPDALAVSPIAAANGWPIFLTDPSTLPASVRTSMETIGANHGYIIGGTGAVSEAVEDELNDHFIGFTRYGGTNRYTTAAIVAEVGFDGMGMLWSRPAIATGENFPDALSGGVLQGSDYSVMLLSTPGSLHPAAAAALETNAESIYELRFLGGESALSQAVRTSAAALLP